MARPSLPRSPTCSQVAPSPRRTAGKVDQGTFRCWPRVGHRRNFSFRTHAHGSVTAGIAGSRNAEALDRHRLHPARTGRHRCLLSMKSRHAPSGSARSSTGVFEGFIGRVQPAPAEGGPLCAPGSSHGRKANTAKSRKQPEPHRRQTSSPGRGGPFGIRWQYLGDQARCNREMKLLRARTAPRRRKSC